MIQAITMFPFDLILTQILTINLMLISKSTILGKFTINLQYLDISTLLHPDYFKTSSLPATIHRIYTHHSTHYFIRINELFYNMKHLEATNWIRIYEFTQEFIGYNKITPKLISQ